jgi:hypothetical protein
MWRDQIEPIARAAGFNTQYDEQFDLLHCKTPDEAYSVTVFQRSGEWYLAHRTFFHLRQGTKLPELLAVLFRERPGSGGSQFVDESGWALPDSLKASFQFEEMSHEHLEELIEPHLKGGLLHRQYLADKFGFRRYSAAEESRGMGLAEAKLLVEQFEGRSITFDPKRVAINDDLIYVPYTYIGCVGYLVERRSKRVGLLGSGTLPHKQIWAYYRGFANGRTGTERLQTLVIRAIRDPEKTREVLWAFLRRDASTRALAKELDNPPCVAREVDLRFFINRFFEAEEKGYFDFEVYPRGAEPCAARNAAPPHP